MKTLLLVRHAKSDWTNSLLSDADRPLNERGKADAPRMAERLLHKKIQIDAFISSPAKRARKTAEFFAKAYKAGKKDIILREALYEAGDEDFFGAIESCKKKWDAIAVFSHNPGLTWFANGLTEVKTDNIPTCGVFAVKIDCPDWSGFRKAKKEFWFFDFPKKED